MTASARFTAAALVISAAAWGCKSSEAPVTEYPEPISTSSPIAVAEVDGRFKAYVPRGWPGWEGPIAVIDVGKAGSGVLGAPSLIREIDVGGGEFATFVAGDGRVLVAISSDFPRVWIIDPETDTVTKTITLEGMGQAFFAGLPNYATSVMVDPDRNRAWVAVWNGYAAIDLAQGVHVPAEDVLAAPSEGPAYDAVRGLIYSPFYDCASASGPEGATPPPCDTYTAPGPVTMPAGLNVVRLSDGAVFTFQDDGVADPSIPVGFEPDAAAVDLVANLVLVADENSATQIVLDMEQAVFDEVTRTVRLPAGGAARHDLEGGAYESIAPDSASGVVLMATEYSRAVAFAVRDGLRAGDAPVIVDMPPLPVGVGGIAWGNSGDPHGAGAFSIKGKSYGILLNEDHTWIARIDVKALAAVAGADPGHLTSNEVAPVVTYLDVTQ